MSKDNLLEMGTQDSFEDVLTDLLRSGASLLLGRAVEAEVGDFLAKYRNVLNNDGHRLIVH